MGEGLWALMQTTTRGRPCLTPLTTVRQGRDATVCFTWWGGLASPLRTGRAGGPASAGWTTRGEALLGSAPVTKLPW